METAFRTRVVSNDAGTYDAECSCGFTSTGWKTKKLATARIGEHTAEHETGVPMPELADFTVEG